MDLQGILKSVNIQTIFKVYLIAISCLTYCVYIGYTLETKNDNNDNIVCNKSKSMHSSVKNGTIVTCSFTEEFVKWRTGRYVDFKQLLSHYASICPMQDSCGVKTDQMLLYPGELYRNVTDCVECACDRSCAYFGNCCPGSHFGYANYTCVNIKLYPKENKMNYYMVGSCLESYKENKTTIELCREEVAPCTGAVSGLIYKNKHCSKCNKEAECIEWKISVECDNADGFEKQMQAFSSHLDMKRALDKNHCIVQFQPPESFTATTCNHRVNGYLGISRVDKCNVSGLWNIYDADIEWACMNFITPYKHFKNVFCYVCNPSHANMQHAPLIDDCSSVTNSAISEACAEMPISKRYAPFKNVFCYICNQGYENIYDKSLPFLKAIKEENSLDLQSRFEIDLQFDRNTSEQFKVFVNHFIPDHFKEIKQDFIPSNTVEFEQEVQNFDAFESIYNSICGTGLLCKERTIVNTTFTTYGNPVCKSCSCDSTCAELESCCFDTLLTRRPYSCYKTNMFPTFYQNTTELGTVFKPSGTSQSHDSYKTVAMCLNENASISVREKCRDGNDLKDRLSSIPISTESGITYRNIYCYACNNNDNDNNNSTISLKFQTICNEFIEHTLFTKLDLLLNDIKNHCQIISFVPLQNKLCTDAYDTKKAAEPRGEKFRRRKLHPSKFKFEVKTILTIAETEDPLPDRSVFEYCNKSGYYRMNENNDIIERLCASEDVNVMSLPEYRVDNYVYKNFACFLCNPEHVLFEEYLNDTTTKCLSNNSVEWYEHNENLEKLCTLTEFHPRWFPYNNMFCAECNRPPWQLVDVHVIKTEVAPAAAYTYIFTISVNDFKHLDEVLEEEDIPDCGQGTYDFFWKQCRPYSCFEGFQIVNSTCKPVLESVVRHEYHISFNVHFQQDVLYDNSSSLKSNKSLSFNFETLTAAIVDNIVKSFDETTVFMIKKSQFEASPCSRDGNQNYIDVFQLDEMNIQLIIRIIKTVNIGMVQLVLLNALKRKFEIKDILDKQGVKRTINLLSGENNLKSSNLFFSPPCIHAKFFTDLEYDSLQYTHFYVDQFLTCGHVKLNSDEVCMHIKSNKISLRNMNATFSDTEYKIIDDTVIICGDLYSRRIYIEPEMVLITKTDEIKSILIVFSITCTIVSLLGLFLTFVTYCLMPPLRTIAGKNIMALCVSLFFSQALLQFGINTEREHTICVAIGISVHLFWLISFCAMNVCSFHTFKVFYYDSNVQPKKYPKGNLFLKYTVYMICVPVSIVMVTITINLIRSEFSNVGYGKFYCFISDFSVFILTFISPACLIFLSNIVFFSLAFHKIRCTPKAQGSRERNNFFICLKLFTIVGIAWPLLIIDNLFGITWFSFIVAGVNSLQGVFIFVSFVVNKHVATLMLTSVQKKPTSRTLSKETNDSKGSLKTFTDVETNASMYQS